MPTAEIWTGAGRDEYHQHPGLSSSKLRDYVNHGVTYYHAVHVLHNFIPEPTAAMQLGARVHDHLLTPPWALPIMIIPEEVLAKNGAKSTNAYRDFVAEYGEQNTLLKASEIAQFRAMELAVDAHDLARQLLLDNDVETEVAIRSTVGAPVRCRIDAISPIGIADLKCHDNLDPSHLAIHTVRMRYDWQMAFYRDLYCQLAGSHDVPCYLVYVRSIPPYQCRVIKLADSWLRVARNEYAVPLEQLIARHEENYWREPDDGAAVEFERPRLADFRDEYRLETELV